MPKTFKCILGMHNWEKFMGIQQHGDKFIQKYRCKVCGKIKEVEK